MNVRVLTLAIALISFPLMCMELDLLEHLDYYTSSDDYTSNDRKNIISIEGTADKKELFKAIDDNDIKRATALIKSGLPLDETNKVNWKERKKKSSHTLYHYHNEDLTPLAY